MTDGGRGALCWLLLDLCAQRLARSLLLTAVCRRQRFIIKYSLPAMLLAELLLSLILLPSTRSTTTIHIPPRLLQAPFPSLLS